MNKTEMREVDIGLLRPNPWNSNVVSPSNEEKIKESFKRFGWFKPVVVRELVDGTLQILGGEHRWEVGKSLGYKTCPIFSVGMVDDKTAKSIGIADNARYGEDDPFQLAQVLSELGGMDELSGFLPYGEEDFNTIFSAAEVNLDDLGLGLEPDKEDSHHEEKPSKPTGRMFRFKIPIDDADWVQRLIETTMKAQGFTSDDALTNAGDALVHILRSAK